MIVRITNKEATTLESFLRDAQYVQNIPPKGRKALRAFAVDVGSRQVNTDRFNMVLPALNALHRTFLGMSARTLRYRHIEVWMRVLVLPAVVKYLLRVLPARLRYERHLNRTAKTVLRIKNAAGGKK